MFGDKMTKIQKLAAKRKSEKLIDLTRDKNADVRLAAIQALGQCEDDNAYNALVPLLHSPSATERRAAAQALGLMGRPSGRAHISHQMSIETDSQVLAAMREALNRLSERY